MGQSGNIFLELRDKVVKGEVNSLEAYGQCKQMKAENDAALAEIEAIALDDAESYEKTFQLKGFKFERRNGATRYSFRHIPKWNEFNDKRKDFEDMCKQALKAGASNMQIADQDGEEIPLPIVTHSKNSLVVKPI